MKRYKIDFEFGYIEMNFNTIGELIYFFQNAGRLDEIVKIKEIT